MLANSILVPVLLGASPTSPPKLVASEVTDQLDSVEITVSDSDAVVVVFDDSGQSIGSLALWVDDAGMTWIAADYADGYAVLSIDPFTETVTHEGDLPAAVLIKEFEPYECPWGL